MNSVREENLKRNAAFMNQLGFSEKRCERDTTLSHEQDVSNRKRKTSRTTVGIESSSSKSQRKSIRIQSNEEKIAIEYKCDKCFNRKIYDSLKGLRIHQSRDCIALDNYKPSSYCILSGEEMKTMFNLNQKFQEIRPKDSSALSATHSQVSFLQQTIFQDNDHVTLQNDQNIELSDEQSNENICTEENPIADDPITSFAEEQEKICSFIFGIEYIHSLTFESMVQAVQMHYEKTETKKSFTKSMSQNSLYQFSIESGLSRNECVKLLSVIKSFDPRIPVPKTFHGVENRMRKSLDQHNDCVQIIVPWIESWRMNELRGFQPVTIYVRNIFEIIAHMLIDPEIMFIWRKHIHFSYYRATDRNNNQVYSDLMSSNWAHETEKMIKSRNQQGNLMPLIMYTDGVQVGNSVHNKITPVILSLGIFSDTLLQKDISKRVIAYLPNFRCYSKDIIISHLVSKLSVSKSKAKRMVAKFELLVERTLYKYLVKQLNSAWDKGIKFHVLGCGLKTFYPCISFFCGDDPCQHRISGVQEGNTSFGCVYCLFPTMKGKVYNPTEHLPRDIQSIKHCCAIAEQVISDEMGHLLTVHTNPEQKAAIRLLKNQNIHPHENPFHYAPMGYDNHIYKANPPDLLHLFCAGLMKSLTQWVLTIILQVNDEGDRKVALFDSRIHNFPYVSTMPHVNWTFFKGGIMQFARKSKKDKLLATGSFGGFRSTAFISALLQIHFAIGFNDDIIKEKYTNIRGSRHSFINVRTKVQRAIEGLLDIYFDCKRREWNPDTLPTLQKKLHLMEVHLTLVWELKQALISTESSTEIAPPKMRNLHKHVHLPMYIKNYGSLIHMDTCTFESYHKVATTAIWRRTSKRHNGLFHEMIQGIMQYDFNNLMCKANRIAKAGLDYILDFEDVLNIEDGVRFKRIRNTSKFRFVMRHDNTKFEIEIPEDESPEIHSKYWKQVSIQNAVNSRTKFREILFRNDIGDQITHAYPDIEWNEEFHDKYETYIIQGISYSSDEDSQMGRGYIYATAKYNKNDSSNADLINKPRYDFVLIKFEGYNTPTLARIIIMFTIDAITENSAEENQIMVVLQLLTESDDKEDANMINQSMGPVYKWAGLIRGSMSGSHVIVAVQSIMRPIFVVPIFREGYNDLKPSPIDRYVALDRHFFERSGWDVENNSSISFHTVEDQMSYLSVNQTAAKLFMSSSTDKERNIPPPDDDNSSTGTMCTSSDEEDSC